MKTTHLHILPECFVDTNLTQILMRVKGVSHQHSCGQVTNVMQKTFYDQFSIGVIDMDKKQSRYSEECVEIAHSNEIVLCRHPGSHHYLIKIINIMERFILNAVDELGLNLADYGIDEGLDGLKTVTKNSDSMNDILLRRLLKDVSHSNEMTLMSDILTYLDKTRYNAKDEEIMAIFAKHGF